MWVCMCVYQRHPDGVASVAFKNPEEADMCVAALNARWFGGRQLSAQLWDGVTDYQVTNTHTQDGVKVRMKLILKEMHYQKVASP